MFLPSKKHADFEVAARRTSVNLLHSLSHFPLDLLIVALFWHKVCLYVGFTNLRHRSHWLQHQSHKLQKNALKLQVQRQTIFLILILSWVRVLLKV